MAEVSGLKRAFMGAMPSLKIYMHRGTSKKKYKERMGKEKQDINTRQSVRDK